jgi:hypothetical protein
VWIRAALLGVVAPQTGADRLSRLRFVRDLQRRFILVVIPIVALVLMLSGASTVQLVLAGVVVLLVADHVRLSLRVRRAEQAT